MKTFLQQLCKILFGGKSDLQMPRYKGRKDGLHELVEDYKIKLRLLLVDYEIIVRSGFVFDGASIPRLLWSFIGHPMEPPRVAAALVHDWLHKAQVLPKYLVDIAYGVIQAMAGISYLSILIEYVALVFFSSRHWRENAKGNIIGARQYGHIDFVNK